MGSEMCIRDRKSIKWDNVQISIPDKIKESIIARYSDVFRMLIDE